jgi:hypothetical protein
VVPPLTTPLILVNIPRLIPKLTGKAYEIAMFTPGPRGLRTLINGLNGELLDSLLTPMMVLFLGLVFSAVLRKRWQVAIVIWVISLARFGLVGPNFASFFSFVVVPTVLLIVTLRYGWLAACFCSLFWPLMIYFPMTTNFSAWYAEGTIFVLTVSVGLILFGFYTSLAGQQLFRSKLLNE